MQDVKELTERFDKIEVHVRTRIAEKKDESSAVDPGSNVASWVSQQKQESVAKTIQQVQLESLSVQLEIGSDMWRELERVSVSKFNGNKHFYPSWKTAFNACIDSAPQSLIGEPLRIVENLGHSKEAYEVAKQCLERKYGGERRLVALYLDELDNLTPIKDGHLKALEKFADLLDVAVVNLQQAQMNSELGSGALYTKLKKNFRKTY